MICDWWYNVDCSQSDQFAEYSNSRIYADAGAVLLDNQDEVMAATGAVAAPAAGAAKKPAKAGKKKSAAA